VLTSTDPGGHKTTFSYTDNFANPNNNGNTHAYVTTVTAPQTSSPNTANHVSTVTYDFNTGLVMASKDQNLNQTRFSYDSMLRTTQTNNPDGGVTQFFYPNSTQVETAEEVSPGNWVYQWTELDGLGRFSRHAVQNGQSSNTWDESVTCYDAVGRVSYQAYPFQDNGWSYGKNCNFAGDTFYYDALSRPTSVVHSDTSSITYSYTGRATQIQDEGNGS